MQKKLFIGDTLTWIDASEHLAADGWSLKCTIQPPSGAAVTVTGTDDGNGNWTFTVAATTTNGWAAGLYFFRKFAERDDEKHTYSSGTFDVVATNTKSHNRQILEALEATIARRATREQEETTIAGRQIKYLSLSELMNQHGHYKRLVEQEEREASGTTSPRSQILISF